jgi:hypothetical protein
MSDVRDKYDNACPDLQPCKSSSLVTVYPHVPKAASSSEGDLHVQTQLGAMRVRVGIKWTPMRMFIGVSALMMMILMTARHMKDHLAIAAWKAHLMTKTLHLNG